MNIEKLKELKDKGFLTQEEFDKQIANYLSISENSDSKRQSASNNPSINLGYLKIKHLLYLAIIGISAYVIVESIFPKNIQCKKEISETGCECVRRTIAHNVSFLDKIKILITGASSEELSYYVGVADTLRCAFLSNGEDKNAIKSNDNTNTTTLKQATSDEKLISENFSNADENDFDKSSETYKVKFWYGNSKENQLLKEKYFNGKLSEDELYNFCDSITSCNAYMRICKEIYHAHHGSSDPYTVLDAEQLSEEQLAEIAIDLCGKKICESEEEIIKYNEIDSGFHIGTWFCGSSGCYLGAYSFPHGDIDTVIAKITKQKKE